MMLLDTTRSPRSPNSPKPSVVKAPKKQRARFAAAAGETAAECAAVCCCCPCGLVSLLVTVAVRLPAGLLLRALRQGSRKKAALSRPRVGAYNDDDGDEDFVVIPHAIALQGSAGQKEAWPERSVAEEMPELEEMMWAYFYDGGFWRSPSQREH